MKKYMITAHARNQTSIPNIAELLYLKNSYEYVGIKLFKKLPYTIKKVEKSQEFKGRLQKYLM